MKLLTATAIAANITTDYWNVVGSPDAAAALADLTKFAVGTINDSTGTIHFAHVEDITRFLTGDSYSTQVIRGGTNIVLEGAGSASVANYGDNFLYVEDVSNFTAGDSIVVIEGQKKGKTPYSADSYSTDGFITETGIIGVTGLIPTVSTDLYAAGANESAVMIPSNNYQHTPSAIAATVMQNNASFSGTSTNYYAPLVNPPTPVNVGGNSSDPFYISCSGDPQALTNLETILTDFSTVAFSGNFTYSSGNVTKILTVPTITGLKVGQMVSGPGITTGTHIASVSGTSVILTQYPVISPEAADSDNDGSVSFVASGFQISSITIGSSSTTIVLSSAGNFSTGQTLTAVFNIATPNNYQPVGWYGGVITAINGTTITTDLTSTSTYLYKIPTPSGGTYTFPYSSSFTATGKTGQMLSGSLSSASPGNVFQPDAFSVGYPLGGMIFGTGNSNVPTWTVTATTSNGSNVLTSVSSVTGLNPGQVVTGTGIPSGTWIVSVGTNTIKMSSSATASGTVSVVSHTSVFSSNGTYSTLTNNVTVNDTVSTTYTFNYTVNSATAFASNITGQNLTLNTSGGNTFTSGLSTAPYIYSDPVNNPVYGGILVMPVVIEDFNGTGNLSLIATVKSIGSNPFTGSYTTDTGYYGTNPRLVDATNYSALIGVTNPTVSDSNDATLFGPVTSAARVQASDNTSTTGIIIPPITGQFSSSIANLVTGMAVTDDKGYVTSGTTVGSPVFTNNPYTFTGTYTGTASTQVLQSVTEPWYLNPDGSYATIQATGDFSDSGLGFGAQTYLINGSVTTGSSTITVSGSDITGIYQTYATGPFRYSLVGFGIPAGTLISNVAGDVTWASPTSATIKMVDSSGTAVVATATSTNSGANAMSASPVLNLMGHVPAAKDAYVKLTANAAGATTTTTTTTASYTTSEIIPTVGSSGLTLTKGPSEIYTPTVVPNGEFQPGIGQVLFSGDITALTSLPLYSTIVTDANGQVPSGTSLTGVSYDPYFNNTYITLSQTPTTTIKTTFAGNFTAMSKTITTQGTVTTVPRIGQVIVGNYFWSGTTGTETIITNVVKSGSNYIITLNQANYYTGSTKLAESITVLDDALVTESFTFTDYPSSSIDSLPNASAKAGDTSVAVKTNSLTPSAINAYASLAGGTGYADIYVAGGVALPTFGSGGYAGFDYVPLVGYTGVDASGYVYGLSGQLQSYYPEGAYVGIPAVFTVTAGTGQYYATGQQITVGSGASAETLTITAVVNDTIICYAQFGQLSGAVSSGATSVTLAYAPSGLSAGQYVTITDNTNGSEVLKVSSISGTTIYFTTATTKAHSVTTYQDSYLNNVDVPPTLWWGFPVFDHPAGFLLRAGGSTTVLGNGSNVLTITSNVFNGRPIFYPGDTFSLPGTVNGIAPTPPSGQSAGPEEFYVIDTGSNNPAYAKNQIVVVSTSNKGTYLNTGVNKGTINYHASGEVLNFGLSPSSEWYGVSFVDDGNQYGLKGAKVLSINAAVPSSQASSADGNGIPYGAGVYVNKNSTKDMTNRKVATWFKLSNGQYLAGGFYNSSYTGIPAGQTQILARIYDGTADDYIYQAFGYSGVISIAGSGTAASFAITGVAKTSTSPGSSFPSGGGVITGSGKDSNGNTITLPTSPAVVAASQVGTTIALSTTGSNMPTGSFTGTFTAIPSGSFGINVTKPIALGATQSTGAWPTNVTFSTYATSVDSVNNIISLSNTVLTGKTTPGSFTVNIVASSTQLTATSTPTGGFTIGGSVTGPGIPLGTTLVSVSGLILTMSQPATASFTGVLATNGIPEVFSNQNQASVTLDSSTNLISYLSKGISTFVYENSIFSVQSSNIVGNQVFITDSQLKNLQQPKAGFYNNNSNFPKAGLYVWEGNVSTYSAFDKVNGTSTGPGVITRPVPFTYDHDTGSFVASYKTGARYFGSSTVGDLEAVVPSQIGSLSGSTLAVAITGGTTTSIVINPPPASDVFNGIDINGTNTITYQSVAPLDLMASGGVVIVGSGETQEAVLLSGNSQRVDGLTPSTSNQYPNVPVSWDLAINQSFTYDHAIDEPVILPNVTAGIYSISSFTGTNGSATTSASASISAGDTSIKMTSVAGMYAGGNLYISDGSNSEYVQISPTWGGGSSVPLVSSTTYAHSGTSYTALMATANKTNIYAGTVSFTATATASSANLTAASSISGLSAGMNVAFYTLQGGYSVLQNLTIVSATGTTVVLSGTIPAGTTTGTVIVVAGTPTNWTVGQTIGGTGISSGTTILSISGNLVGLSSPTTNTVIAANSLTTYPTIIVDYNSATVLTNITNSGIFPIGGELISLSSSTNLGIQSGTLINAIALLPHKIVLNLSLPALSAPAAFYVGDAFINSHAKGAPVLGNADLGDETPALVASNGSGTDAVNATAFVGMSQPWSTPGSNGESAVSASLSQTAPINSKEIYINSGAGFPTAYPTIIPYDMACTPIVGLVNGNIRYGSTQIPFVETGSTPNQIPFAVNIGNDNYTVLSIGLDSVGNKVLMLNTSTDDSYPDLTEIHLTTYDTNQTYSQITLPHFYLSGIVLDCALNGTPTVTVTKTTNLSVGMLVTGTGIPVSPQVVGGVFIGSINAVNNTITLVNSTNIAVSALISSSNISLTFGSQGIIVGQNVGNVSSNVVGNLYTTPSSCMIPSGTAITISYGGQSQKLTIAPTGNLTVGVTVAGTGIPSGATITALDVVNAMATLNSAATATGTYSFQCISRPMTFNGTITNGSTIITNIETQVMPGDTNVPVIPFVSNFNFPTSTGSNGVISNFGTLVTVDLQQPLGSGDVIVIGENNVYQQLTVSEKTPISGSAFIPVKPFIPAYNFDSNMNGFTINADVIAGDETIQFTSMNDSMMWTQMLGDTGTGLYLSFGQNNLFVDSPFVTDVIESPVASAILSANATLGTSTITVSSIPNTLSVGQKPISVSAIGSTTIGSTIVQVSTNVGISVGMTVYGSGVQAGCTVIAIGNGTVTLSQSAYATNSGKYIYFSVFPYNTTIISFTGNTIFLTQPSLLAISSGQTLQFNGVTGLTLNQPALLTTSVSTTLTVGSINFMKPYGLVIGSGKNQETIYPVTTPTFVSSNNYALELSSPTNYAHNTNEEITYNEYPSVPAIGDVVYDSAINGFKMYDGSAWRTARVNSVQAHYAVKVSS